MCSCEQKDPDISSDSLAVARIPSGNCCCPTLDEEVRALK